MPNTAAEPPEAIRPKFFNNRRNPIMAAIRTSKFDVDASDWEVVFVHDHNQLVRS